MHGHGSVVGVGRRQGQDAVLRGQALDREVAVERGDHDVPGLGLKRSVDDQQVAIVDHRPHGVALTLDEVGCRPADG